MAADFYVLECEAEGCDAEFWLNDIPVVLRGPKHGEYASTPVNQLVRDGVNTISAIIRPGPKPSEAATGGDKGKSRRAPADEKVWAKLSAYPMHAVVGGPDAEHLVEFHWPPDPKVAEEHPLVISASKDLGELFGPWAHQSAAPLTLDEPTRAEILAYLKEIRALLEAGDCEGFLDKQKVRVAETALAYGKRPANKKNEIRRVIADEFGKPSWVLLPIPEDKLDLRLVGEGRVVDCIGTDWEPLVRRGPDADGNGGFFEMMLSKIDDQWQIVR
ncbi:MAG: hypothetical protein U0414_28575 [Polyangiaceae bacterium]